jgi:hypothetical protein
VGETSWLFLIIGSFAALGAAMAAGTFAALWRHRKTGTMPGSDEPTELSRGKLISLWIRIVVGAVVAVAGIIWIQRTGIF